jgi:uncharacterized protein YkwD
MPRVGHVRFVAFVALVTLFCALVSPTSANASARRLSRATTTSYAHKMLSILNRERAAHHLRPLHLNAKLVRSAHWHNLHMARANTLSHQLPHERSFDRRISRTGYSWRMVAENIATTSRVSWHGTSAMEYAMYREKAPNNGHRQNILNRQYRAVGVDVYYDAAHHRLWITQDFARHS